MGPPRSKNKGAGNKAEKIFPRKKRRQQERAAKKQRNALFHRTPAALATAGKSPTLPGPGPAANSTARQLKRPRGKAPPVSSQGQAPHSKPPPIAANHKDEEEIAKLEKLLKINRKKKTVPNSFHQDGLDCILWVLEKVLMVEMGKGLL